MGGLVDLPGNISPLAEYNFWADPEAAEIVLKSGAKMTLVGWDTTLQASSLSIEELNDVTQGPSKYGKLVADLQQKRISWSQSQNLPVRINIADALLMAVAIDPKLIQRSAYYEMSVNSGSPDDSKRGFLSASLSKNPSAIRFVHEVNRHGYLSMLKQCFTSIH